MKKCQVPWGGFFLTHTVVHSTETKTLNMYSYCTMVVFKGDVVDHCNKKGVKLVYCIRGSHWNERTRSVVRK